MPLDTLRSEYMVACNTMLVGKKTDYMVNVHWSGTLI